MAQTRKCLQRVNIIPVNGKNLSVKGLLGSRLTEKKPMRKHQQHFLNFSFSLLQKGFSSFLLSEEIAVKNYFIALKMKTFAY